ncbi:MAG: pectate lyase [Prevotella sp.]|nr:pectate lyase [Prevotella sp.]MBR5060918.1 pectate lyase [Prevotella sp.]
MKKIICLMLLFGCFMMNMYAANASNMKWSDICAGKMDANWYGSNEAQQIANVVLLVQKTNGGWMKNDQLHKLSDAEISALYNVRHEHSCLDNGATTMEMRFLAKVYQKTKVEDYRESFLKALNMIFQAEKGCGGWSQYWPLSGNGSYQDYITFNDDLMTNVMRLLQDIASGKGDFANMVDNVTRQRCEKSIQHAIDVIIKCQVDDNGTPAAWCAQHDTITFLPTEGRPHELPSISGSESASLLSYLMTIEKPSKQLQQTIHTAVAWLDSHKIDGKAVEDFTNANGEKDRRVVDRAGSAVWGRFIQLGGAKAEETYKAFFEKLRKRGKTRSYTTGGKTYTYSEYEIATKSYNPDKAYQPIFAIYDNALAHLFYRFLYNFEDSEPTVDWRGCTVTTSLNAIRRTSYQFMGSWPLNVIKSEYPAWKQRVEAQEASEGYETHALSAETYQESNPNTTYLFSGGISVSNEKGKGYATGKSNTIKYSAGVDYTIQLPDGMKIDKVQFTGYDNYDVDAYINSFNGTTFDADDYVFPAKEDGNPVYVSHTLDVSNRPIEGSFTFKLASKQCCLVITLYQKDNANGICLPLGDSQETGCKFLYDGRLLIRKDGKLFDASGTMVLP